MEEVMLGKYAIAPLMTVLLAVIYKVVNVEVGPRIKPLIAIALGVGLAVIAIPYNGLEWTVINIVDHLIYGLMLGASAVGLYELQKSVKKPPA